MRVGEGPEQRVRDVEVHDRDAVLGATPVGLVELVEQALTDRVRLVVLVDAGPSQHGLPEQVVEPRVLERGAHEARRIPVERLEDHVGHRHAEAEAAVHDGVGSGLVELRHLRGDVLRGLRDRLLVDDPDARSLARGAEVGDVGVADVRALDQRADGLDTRR